MPPEVRKKEAATSLTLGVRFEQAVEVLHEPRAPEKREEVEQDDSRARVR
ncbi:MAG: hypothetical protein ACJAYU_000896 [Bradymonadia bacterium]|jgi:hypothetical protein